MIHPMSTKITLIGAGSVVFAKNLIGDILQFPELSDATICLMDIDPQRLKVAKLMAEKMVAVLKVKAKIQATLNQREAVRGAKYVICTVQVGGYQPCTVIDFEVPKKYGLKQTIADTLGVGGVFRALRTIPVINKVAQDIAEVGDPKCLLLNYTNPMAMNCWAVDKGVGIPHVGLCHSVQGTSRQLANFAGLPYEDVSYIVAGINHMAFFLRFEYKGQDAYPLLFKLLEDPKFTSEKVRFEMMRRTGYFVTESSEHQSEYVPYFIHHGDDIIKKFDIPIDEYIRRCKSIIASWKDSERELLGHDGQIHVGPQSHEYGSFIIHSSETNINRVIYGNVPNRGLITNLPEGCCVEVPCLVNRNGVQPTHIGDLPPQLAGICRTNINVQELTVEAALTQKREHIYHAIMLDPHAATVLTLDKMWAMCDELIAAHQKEGFLGEFKPVVKNTGRSYAGTGDRIVARAKIKYTGPTVDASQVTTEVTVSNPTAKAITIPFKLTASQNGKKADKSASLKVTIPAGKTVKKEVKVPVPFTSQEEKYYILLETETPGVLSLNAVGTVRRKLTKNAKNVIPFEIELHGFPAAKAELSSDDKVLELSLKVDDSKVSPEIKTPWIGSSVELFFADVNDAKIQQFFIVPQQRGQKAVALNSQLKEVKEITATQEIASNGYTMKVRIPRKVLGKVGQDETFLFDVIANLSALGDAHSGGRAAWNGQLQSHENSDHYALITLA